MINILRSQAKTVEGYISTAIGYLNPVWYTFRQYTHTFTVVGQVDSVTMSLTMPATTGIVNGHKIRISGGPYDGVEVGTVTAVAPTSINFTGMVFRGTAAGYLVNLTVYRNLSLESELLDPITGLSISKATSLWATKPDLTGNIDVQSELRSLFYSKQEVPAVTAYGVILKNITTGLFKLRYRETYLDTSNIVQKGSWTTIAEDCVGVPARKQIQEAYGNNLIDWSIKNQSTKQVLFNPDFNDGLEQWKAEDIYASDSPWDDSQPSFAVARCKVTDAEQFLDPKCDDAVSVGYNQAGTGGWVTGAGEFETTITAGGLSAVIFNRKELQVTEQWAILNLIGTTATGNSVRIYAGRYDVAGTLIGSIGFYDAADNGTQVHWPILFTPGAGQYLGIYVVNNGGVPCTFALRTFVRVKGAQSLTQPVKMGGLISGAKTFRMTVPERIGEIGFDFQVYATDTKAAAGAGEGIYQNIVPVAALPSSFTYTVTTPRSRLGFTVLSNVDVRVNYFNVDGVPPGKLLTRFSRLRKWKGVPRTVGYLFDGVVGFGPQLQVIQYAYNSIGDYIGTARLATQNIAATDVGVYQFILADDPNASFYLIDIVSPTAGVGLCEQKYIDAVDLCQPGIVLEWQNSMGGFDQWGFTRKIDIAMEPGKTPDITESYDPDIENSKGTLSRDGVDTQGTFTVYDDFVPTEYVVAFDELKKSKLVKLLWANGSFIYVVPVTLSTMFTSRAKFTQVMVTLRMPRNFNPNLAVPLS